MPDKPKPIPASALTPDSPNTSGEEVQPYTLPPPQPKEQAQLDLLKRLDSILQDEPMPTHHGNTTYTYQEAQAQPKPINSEQTGQQKPSMSLSAFRKRMIG